MCTRVCVHTNVCVPEVSIGDLPSLIELHFIFILKTSLAAQRVQGQPGLHKILSEEFFLYKLCCTQLAQVVMSSFPK